MKKKSVILVGCGEHAKMVIDNIEECSSFEIIGLTTNSPDEISKRIYGYPVICLDENIPELIQNEKIDGYFLGVGIAKGMFLRKKLYSWLDTFLEAVNIIHPLCQVSKYSKIGKGNIFEAYTKIANDATVGNHCILNSFSSINHDQTIGDNVLIACNVSLAGRKIGSHTIIADGASIAFKRSVGENCIVGDGSVVTKDLPDNSIAYGNPAKIIKKNNIDDRKETLHTV